MRPHRIRVDPVVLGAKGNRKKTAAVAGDCELKLSKAPTARISARPAGQPRTRADSKIETRPRNKNNECSR